MSEEKKNPGKEEEEVKTKETSDDSETGEEKETPESNQEEETHKKDEDSREDDEEQEPGIRKGPKDFIIDRQKETIGKLRKKPSPDEEEEHEEEDDEFGDEELTPEAQKAIEKEVGRVTAPLAERVSESQVEREVDDYIRGNPASSAHRAKLIRYAKHPAYRQVPIEFIAKGLDAENAEKRGAEKERSAKTRSDGSRTGGSSVRQTGGAYPDFRSMSPKEFKEYSEKIRRGETS